MSSEAAAAAAAVEELQAHRQPQQQQPAACADEQPQAAQQQQEEGCNSSSSPRENEPEQCHICMNSMQDAAAVKGCGHRFCLTCIQQWVSTRQQPCCPVCRAEVKTLVLADGSEQVAEPAAAAPPAEAEPDLSCLDHSYFLAEVSRLRSRAQSVHDRVYREAYGCGRRGNAHSSGLTLDGVQDVLDTLAGYRSTLEGETRFDPQVLLHELYRLDRELTSLQAGSSGSAPTAAGDDAAGSAAEHDPWQTQQAADRLAHLHMHGDDHDAHEHEHENDYDYDYDSADDDDWHEGLSRTPGRRPNQRGSVVKHARSNSGGGGQQQQGQQQQRQQLTPQQRGPIPRWRQGQGQGRQRGGSGNGPTGL